MRALLKAIYDRLTGDAQLSLLLGKTVGQPSVFTKRPIPDEAGTPAILAVTAVSDVDEDYLVGRGRSIVRDVAVYGDEKDFDQVVDASERVRSLFHRQPLEVAGFDCISVVAAGPRDAPSDPYDLGRVVTLTVRVRERL